MARWSFLSSESPYCPRKVSIVPGKSLVSRQSPSFSWFPFLGQVSFPFGLLVKTSSLSVIFTNDLFVLILMFNICAKPTLRS